MKEPRKQSRHFAINIFNFLRIVYKYLLLALLEKKSRLISGIYRKLFNIHSKIEFELVLMILLEIILRDYTMNFVKNYSQYSFTIFFKENLEFIQ